MHERAVLLIFIFLFLVALVVMLFPLREKRGILLFLVPVLTISLGSGYWYWGNWSAWQSYRQQEAKRKQVQILSQALKPAEIIAKLKQRLEGEPQSERGWYLLGRLYASQGKWLLAQNSFTKAMRLNPHSEVYVLNYAQAYLQLNQQLDEQVRDLISTVLQKNPQQADALTLLAMDAYKHQKYLQAIDYWQNLLKLLPQTSEEAQLVKKAIAKAQNKFNLLRN